MNGETGEYAKMTRKWIDIRHTKGCKKRVSLTTPNVPTEYVIKHDTHKFICLYTIITRSTAWFGANNMSNDFQTWFEICRRVSTSITQLLQVFENSRIAG